MMTKLTQGVTSHIEELLKQYPHTSQIIEHERSQLRIDSQIAELVGSNPTEFEQAISAQRQSTLEHFHTIIDQCLELADEDTRTIIRLYYFEQSKNVDGVAMVIHLSKAQVSRKKNRFIELVAIRLGYV